MKRFRLIPAVVLISLFSFPQSCDELDPKCENAKYDTVELLANPTDGDMDLLKWHLQDKNWYYYFEYQTGDACGHSTLDLTLSALYDRAVPEDNGIVMLPYLMVNGEEIKNVITTFAVSAYGEGSSLLKGGFYKLYKKGTPYQFNIRCGVYLKKISRSLTEEEAKDLVEKYLYTMEVKFEYLKL